MLKVPDFLGNLGIVESWVDDFLGFLFSFEMFEKFLGMRVKYMITKS